MCDDLVGRMLVQDQIDIGVLLMECGKHFCEMIRGEHGHAADMDLLFRVDVLKHFSVPLQRLSCIFQEDLPFLGQFEFSRIPPDQGDIQFFLQPADLF